MTNIFNNKELSAIIIAHRLQTVIRCNYLYALKNGEIIEQGTPDDLIKKRGIFYNMINIQGIKNETWWQLHFFLKKLLSLLQFLFHQLL